MRYILAAAAVVALQVSAAHAETIVALTGDNMLTSIDSATGKIMGQSKLAGIGAVLGIDVRPSDGQLYALASDGMVASIDPMSGQTTPKSKLEVPPPAGIKISVDFNPVADRLRIIGSDGTNLRADVDSGKVTVDLPLKFADADAAGGRMPLVVAASYTNSMQGAKDTTLHDIDGGLGGLFRQAPPNDGMLNSIGMLGVDAGNVAFDIAPDGTGNNVGMLIANGNLYSVDLTSGKAAAGKTIAGLPSNVRDIGVLPVKAVTMTIGASPATTKAETTPGYLPDPRYIMKPGQEMSSASMTKATASMVPMQSKGGYGMQRGHARPAYSAKRHNNHCDR